MWKIANMSWSSELELESGGLGVRGQESGVSTQGSGVRVGVLSWSWRTELAVERRSERMDAAYSPRVHEEEPSAAANLCHFGGGAEVRASGYGVFAEGPRGGASGRRQRAGRAKASLPAAANLLQQIANSKRNGLCDSLMAGRRGMQTISFCIAEIRIVRARDGIKP